MWGIELDLIPVLDEIDLVVVWVAENDVIAATVDRHGSGFWVAVGNYLFWRQDRI